MAKHNEKIECKCSCGESLLKFDSRGRERKYIHGHSPNGSRTRFKKGNIPWLKSPGVDIVCRYCGEIFNRQPSKADRQYCSRACCNKSKVGTIVSAEARKNISLAARNRKPFTIPGNTGIKHWNWKGGNSSLRHREMNSGLYKRWRTSVFERDNYTCQTCEQYGGTLHADHIERWADNEELRYDVDNGRTLCVACHYYVTFKKKMKPGQRWCNFVARERG